jgi:hypothetical protein
MASRYLLSPYSGAVVYREQAAAKFSVIAAAPDFSME